MFAVDELMAIFQEDKVVKAADEAGVNAGRVRVRVRGRGRVRVRGRVSLTLTLRVRRRGSAAAGRSPRGSRSPG